jgi:hypothetical protein
MLGTLLYRWATSSVPFHFWGLTFLLHSWQSISQAVGTPLSKVKVLGESVQQSSHWRCDICTPFSRLPSGALAWLLIEWPALSLKNCRANLKFWMTSLSKGLLLLQSGSYVGQRFNPFWNSVEWTLVLVFVKATIFFTPLGVALLAYHLKTREHFTGSWTPIFNLLSFGDY